MELTLYQHNRRSERVENPTLKELLASSEPFVISAPETERLRRNHIVYAQWRHGEEGLLDGILVIDYDAEIKYLVKRGEHQFKESEGTDGPYHADKFRGGANFYELRDNDFQDLKSEFEQLGFSFPDR